MDTATVTALRHLAVPDPGDGSAALSHLTTEEQRAYRLLFTEGKLRIVKLNTDENPQTAARYGITSIPTMHVFFQGDVAKTIIGAQPKPKLLKELDASAGATPTPRATAAASAGATNFLAEK